MAELEKSPLLPANKKIKSYYQSLAATNALIDDCLAEVIEVRENLGEAAVKGLYKAIFIDLYGAIQCVVCRQPPRTMIPCDAVAVKTPIIALGSARKLIGRTSTKHIVIKNRDFWLALRQLANLTQR